jgi:Big-like domain-containing protein/calcineurin-like phosphoesterase family protein
MPFGYQGPSGIARLNAAGAIALCLVLITPTACFRSAVEPVSSTEPVATVTVNPAFATLMVGNSTTLNAILEDANGNRISGRVVTWASDNAAASVDGAGHVTGNSPGGATVTATSEGKSGAASITVIPPPPPGSTNVLVGAGDIANGGPGAEATAALLDHIGGTVFTAGDNAYPDGADANYAQYYEPTWGRHKARTRPCPGNHDYHTAGAAAYYNYFGASAGPAGRGYYSYDLGDWHIISLNSNIDMTAGSAQGQWLSADLAANSRDCILATWHEPRFSSGTHGSSTAVQPLYQALYDAGAEIVVVGHDHNYQRFAPQTPTGQLDPARGIRQFVAGTGGAGHYDFTTPIANTEAYNNSTYGVLKLTLGPGVYSWEFIPEAGKTYTDSGSGTCHR